MGEHRVVAVGDILGFSRTVLSNSLDAVVRGPIEFLMKALHHSTQKDRWPTERPTLRDLRNQSRVGVAFFSDTVLLYGLDDSDEAAANVVETAAWLLFETFHSPHTRMRMGVDYGEVHTDEENGVYVGPAIVRAYRLEEAQEWCGGALTREAEDRILRTSAEPWTVEYAVPLKAECDATSRRAINWFYAKIHLKLPLEWPAAGPEPSPEATDRVAKIVLKWRNTKKFHESTCEQCRS